MPVMNHWDNEEKTAYTFIMQDQWDWSEFLDALREGFDAIKAVEHPVNIIYVFISKLPDGDPTQYLMLAGENQPKNSHHTVVVNLGMDDLKTIVTSIDNMRQWVGPQFVDTLEEARQYLSKIK